MAYRTSFERLKQFFAETGGSPKKGFSQNFLIDANIVNKIVHTAGVQEGDSVLEIGPGFGALTEKLLLAGASVTAVEKDPLFHNELKSMPITLYLQDAMKFDLSCIDTSKKRAKVVANLPYHLTTPLLVKLFLEGFNKWSSVTVTVQYEVAKRIASKPGHADYGSLTLFLNFFSSVRSLFKISSSCFYPKPSVDSATVHLDVKEKLPIEPSKDRDLFFVMTRAAFGQRRKFLSNSLSAVYDKKKVVDALESMGLSSRTRPENLSLEEYLALFEMLKS
ncbi:16S rRNA (adenine(1518)-N(6)/adenine(1519)-N(6))-dimethyltransferase RsmA [Chlamydiifrater phoenicopteri]|uniref:16S rRNA (adenine(1518)-N(6)/adenine(1519)-N(6))- dimethyltransferase RsmA n=1 Tax=Chlamydiifrater phoenicopteri TaxID=2681469 RepID=UPI001BCFF182|nr:16S rRNA (adenine(1518)-N(6)/adenine(1519)-N(6))-dimethyltransferase RsmA [Chlamydiifrater phoenicopteri]